MTVENKGPEISSQLNEEEAMDEANMMRSYLEKNNKENNPTKEDYEKAFKVIDELIKKADEETTAKEFLLAIGDVLNKGSFLLTNMLATIFPENWRNKLEDINERDYQKIKLNLRSAKEELAVYKNKESEIVK